MRKYSPSGKRVLYRVRIISFEYRVPYISLLAF
jgi:hypothetical protein